MALIDGLTHYYKCDETTGATMSDSEGTDDGTNQNMENADWVAGHINNAINYDAAFEHTIMPFNLGVDSTGSVSFWYNPDDTGTYDMLMGSHVSPGNNQGDWLIQMTADAIIWYRIYSAGPTSEVIAGTTTVTNGAWSHIVFTWGSGGMDLYVDNVDEGNDAATQAPTGRGGETDFAIGWNKNTGHNYANGQIDEIGIWDKQLSVSEVNELYNGGDGLAYPFGVALTFNQGSLIL